MTASLTDVRGQTDRGVRARGSGRRLVGTLLVGILLLAGCGGSGSGQTGSGFVFLTVEFFSLDGTSPTAEVKSSLADKSTSTLACVTLRNNLKNPTVTTPTGLDNVFIESYTVRLTRLDGGPSPGPFTINTAVTVPAGTISTTGLTGNTAKLVVVVVAAQLKNEPPLSQASPLPLNATADITFRGRDGRGQRTETRGAIAVLFVGTGTDSAASCGSATSGGTTTSGTMGTTGTTL